MKHSFFDRRIPSVIGLILLVIGLGVSSFLLQTQTQSGTKASISSVPQEVHVANITESSFTVVYTTSAYVSGSISYGTSTGLGNLALDDRDQKTGSPQNHNVHIFTIRKINPSTTYYFAIVSDSTTYQNNGKPYQAVTGVVISNPPSIQKPITGKITLPDGTVPREGFVYISSPQTQAVASLINNDGSFIVPLNNIRTADLAQYSVLVPDTTFTLFASDALHISTVTFNPTILQTIPAIELSQNYDFSSPQPTAIPAISSGFTAPLNQSTANQGQLSVVSPSENQTFTDSQPQFSGTTLPSIPVTISFDSNSVAAKVVADTAGNWQYRPSTEIAEGNHTIIISSQDENGVTETVKRDFVVFASGSQVSQSATPSASPTVSIEPTDTPTPSVATTATPTIAVTISPTQSASISPSPTFIPTLSPTLAVTTIPTPTIVSTGPGSTILAIGAVGIVLSILGGLLFFAL